MRRANALTMLSLAVVLAFGAGACGGDSKSAGTDTPVAATATPKASYPMEVQLTDADNGRTVQLAQGGKLIIALQSNPSTGFSWYAGELAGPQLRLAGEPEYVPPASTTPVVGAVGTQVFTFEAPAGIALDPATQTGIVQLSMEYRRGFEPNAAPDKKFAVTVEIHGASGGSPTP